jgi:predicted RNA-binding protein YlxR (DUF448 family)
MKMERIPGEGKMTEEILRELIRLGKITEEDILVARKRNPTNEMKRIVDLIHGVFCVAEHAPHGCGYYVEENEPSAWQLTEHQVWIELTMSLMQELSIGSEREMLDCYRAARKTKEEIESLTPQAQDLLQRLLKIP